MYTKTIKNLSLPILLDRPAEILQQSHQIQSFPTTLILHSHSKVPDISTLFQNNTHEDRMQYKEIPVEMLWPDASIMPVGISSQTITDLPKQSIIKLSVSRPLDSVNHVYTTEICSDSIHEFRVENVKIQRKRSCVIY